MISPRELDLTQLSNGWINTHFIYTHGYGVVMAEANQVSPNGLPVLAGAPTLSGRVTNRAFVFSASFQPSAITQFGLSFQANRYTPLQQPGIAGPPQYVITPSVRTKITRTLFLNASRPYYFNWGGLRWAPQFTLLVTAQ